MIFRLVFIKSSEKDDSTSNLGSQTHSFIDIPLTTRKLPLQSYISTLKLSEDDLKENNTHEAEQSTDGRGDTPSSHENELKYSKLSARDSNEVDSSSTGKYMDYGSTASSKEKALHSRGLESEEAMLDERGEQASVDFFELLQEEIA